jgi:hypothetical protein
MATGWPQVYTDHKIDYYTKKLTGDDWLQYWLEVDDLHWPTSWLQVMTD